LIEINHNFQKKIEDKLKKVYESTDLIKRLELQKTKERENKNISKFGKFYSQMQNKKQSFEEKRSKEKKKIVQVRENYEEMQREYEVKKIELSNKLKTKKQTLVKDIINRKMDIYINKRQSSYDKFMENYSNIKKLTTRRNLRLLRFQQIRNRRSFDKLKSVDVSRDNIR